VPRVSQEHLSARRRQIMEAAIACFARAGFHRTTMKDIVEESRLSAGAFYRYFDSKEDIVAAIAEEHHAPEAAVLSATADGTDPVETLRRLVDASLGRLSEAAEQRWRRVTVQLWAEALRDERIMQVVRSGLDGPLEALAAVIRKGQRTGQLAEGLDPDAMARVCAAIFQGLVLQQAWDPGVDVETYMNTVTAFIEALGSPRARTGARH
jgi:AcrR family transcriptional regulator